MNHVIHHIILAAGSAPGTVTVGGQDFWTTSIGTMLGAFLKVMGLLVVVFAIVRVVQHVAKGDIAKAVKSVLGSVILAAFLFQPSLVQGAINVGGTVVNAVIDTVSQVAGGSSQTPATTPPATPAN